MTITSDNYQIANDATRDILYMYVDLIESYGGFGHNINTGSFDPLSFIDVDVIEPEGASLEIDVAFLQSGSSIALLCALSDAWDEYDTWNVKHWSLMTEIKKAFEGKRFTHLLEINKAIELGFGKDEVAFREQLEVVYRKYVCAYFHELLESC